MPQITMRTLMDTREEDKIHLMSIADSIREIQGYLGRADFDAYAQRDDIREAISSQLLQIGGAAAALSDDFKEKYADVDWDVLKGLQYANFDQELEMDLHPQWYIVKNDLPEMMNQIVDLSAQLEREDAMEDDLEMTGEAGPEDNLSPGSVGSKPDFSETDASALTISSDFEDDPYDEDTDEEFDDEDDTLFDEEVDVDTLDVDIEDDSFIDRRFTDDDLMDDSELDDDVYDDEDDDFEEDDEK